MMETLQNMVGFVFLGVIIVGLMSLLLAQAEEQILVGIASMLIGYGLYNILITTTVGGALMLGGLAVFSLGFTNLTQKGSRRRNFY